MTLFLLRKIGFFLATMIGTSLLIFIVIREAGGDVVSVILGDSGTPEAAAQLRAELGLDRPLPIQYLDWMGGLVRGDLGRSFLTAQPISGLVVDRLPITIPLIVGAMIISTITAVVVGVFAARYAESWFGALIAGLSQVGIAVPAVWLGLILAIIFGVSLGWLPTGGWTPWTADPLASLRSLVLPMISLALILAAGLTRFVRSAVLEVMSDDFVRTARAGGMRYGEALVRVGLRNASLPILTVLGLQAVELIGGTVIIETVYSLPGLSRLILDAVAQREVIVVQSTVMVLVVLVMVINLLVDLGYGLLDPRVRRQA